MARTNVATLKPRLRTHEGAPARRIAVEQELRRSVMACLLWENTFYESGVDIAERIRSLAANVSIETVAQIAIEARERMYLRHAPLWLAVAMAPRGGRIVGDTVARIIQRADELGELLALYWKDGKKPISAQIKRGLAEAFTKFDAYQLAKYDRPGSVRLRDVLFLTHPKPTSEQQAETWRQLVDGTLPAPDTWEVALSGGTDEKETWTRLLSENKLGGLALLRNLRNMTQAGVDRGLIRESIRSNRFSRVLPFRFIAAAKHAPDMEDVLEEAMFRSTAELPKLPGRTALLLDNSGSMIGVKVSAKSELDRVDAAAGLAMLIREIAEEPLVIGFGSTAQVLPPRRGFALAEAYRRGPGGGTYTESAKQLADKYGYDRIIILTDEQSHQALSNPNGRGYVVNVASYKNGIGYGAWNHLDGFSENVVRWIGEFEASDI